MFGSLRQHMRDEMRGRGGLDLAQQGVRWCFKGEPSTISTTQSNVSTPPKYAQPYIQEFLGAAGERYASEAPQFFEGQTFVPFSGQTEAGLGQIESRALGGSPISQAGQDEYLKTLQGDYLNPETNPHLQGAINAAINPIQERLMEETLPQISGQFSRAGRYGSNAQGNEMLQAGRGAVRGMSEAASNIAFQNYLGERGRQQQAALGAPDYALRDYDDPNRLLNVGAAREDLMGRELRDAMARHDFEQNREQLKLQEYGNAIRQGVFGGTSTGTNQTPYYGPDKGLGALGMFTAGAGALGGTAAAPVGK